MNNKKIFFALIAFSFSVSLAAQINDDFSDGNFTTNPLWNGDNANFEVDLNGRLHLNAPEVTDTSYLSVASEAIINASWEFFTEMDFDPSSSNFSKVYLVSNQENLTGSLNGYFVKLGNSNDNISLYRQDGFTETLLIDGGEGLLGLTNSNDASVKVTRDNFGNWELLADTSVSNNYVSQGIATDNTYLATSYFGVYAKYTSTRSDLFYFDDIIVNGSAFTDDIAPTVEIINVVSDTEIDVLFSEEIDPTNAIVVANYIVDNSIGNPSTVTIDGFNSSLLHLVFTQTFGNGIENNITIENVSDTAGNTMISETLSFTFTQISIAAYKNVVFNEIFADPTPSLGLPESEFVEIYNSTNEYFDLLDWKFVNSTTEKILPAYSLAPSEFLILCDVDDTSLYSSFGNVLPISSFSALSNEGDSLSLVNQLGQIIDVVFYAIDWYNDAIKSDGGWSLELINSETPCSNFTNWTASNSAIGGTPGTINSVFNNTPDTTSPTIESYSIVNANTISINFNEAMDANSLLSAIYTIDNSNSIVSNSIGSIANSIVLNLLNSLDTGVVYTISTTGASDCVGNFIAAGTTVIFTIGYSPLYGNVLINEIMADPTPEIGLPAAEYLELINTSDKIIDLSNCSINDYNFPANTIIDPNNYLLIIDDEYQNLFPNISNKTVISWGESFFTNDGKEIVLKSASNQELDRVNYSVDWYRDDDKNDGGWSLERINPDAPCLASENWSASISNFGGTPGTQNSIYDTTPDLAAPLLLSSQVIDENTIELVFNEKLDTSTVSLGNYVFTENIQVSSLEIVSPNYTNILAELTEPLLGEVVYFVSVTDVSDCSGNSIVNSNSIAFGLPEEPVKGDVIINEALFYPRTGGVDFVEIYNNSTKIISLKNWKLANIEDDEIANQKEITDLPIILLPNDFCVLTNDKENILSEYSNAISNKFIEMESMPAYNNSDGTIVLIGAFIRENDSIVVTEQDRFGYSESLHFPLINNLEGISLERIDYNRPTTDYTNWLSAASNVGFATPGFKNSQYHQTAEGNSEITIEPEVFSPDNDGYLDVVNINYNFKNVGFTGNFIIYDGKGRVIKNLLKNELLPEKGTVSWNGITDENEKARIGIYIVYAEIFDLQGNVKSFKKSCVLGGKF
jgi:Lamin Tail Domain